MADPLAVSRSWKHLVWSGALVTSVVAGSPLTAAETPPADPAPPIRSYGALTFGPPGILFVGDGKGGAVYAFDTGDVARREGRDPVKVGDLETKLAALLGTRASEVMVHDLAVNPLSQNIYLSVSRGRASWDTRWQQPNHVADATMLVRVDPDGKLAEVTARGLPWSRVELPRLVDPAHPHEWQKELSARTEAISDLAWSEGTLWIAGLSNEEFSSALWSVQYPFTGTTTVSTVEIFHGAHEKWETASPIRALLPYRLGNVDQLLAAYLCTPLVLFDRTALTNGAHVKGRTIAELGSGNYPLDMVEIERNGVRRLVLANSNLPYTVLDPADLASYQGAITTGVPTYTAGVRFDMRSASGVQQLDRLNADWLISLVRLPGGTLDLEAISVARFIG